ncbi:MAG: maleylpyruvate isomerase family mycothiol-dependent enzyme [Catenulispora sp.]|nr:maleylpyruvate isomerase family mycothiol-dependent enzyme [Catenulispora sp.]
MPVDLNTVWTAVDTERLSLAALLEDLDDDEWETPSLCAGWRVREVAAHLTQAHAGVWAATRGIVRARGDFNRMIDMLARERTATLPASEYPALLRAMVGSRRKAPGVSALEPLIDLLVHGQDITIPLARERAMPIEATRLAIERVWPDLFPFRAGRRFAGIGFTATDCSWTGGEGTPVEGPVSAILLVLTGRPAGLSRLSGLGVTEVGERLAALRTPAP